MKTLIICAILIIAYLIPNLLICTASSLISLILYENYIKNKRCLTDICYKIYKDYLKL